MAFFVFAEALPPPPQKLQIVFEMGFQYPDWEKDAAACKITRLTHWLKLDTWSAEIGAYLINGIVPSTVDKPELLGKVVNLANGTLIDPTFLIHHVNHVLMLWNSQLNPPEKIRPIDFIAWCKTKNIETGWITNADEWEEYEAAHKQQAETNINKIDWQHWLRRDVWSETECLCLINSVLPDYYYELIKLEIRCDSDIQLLSKIDEIRQLLDSSKKINKICPVKDDLYLPLKFVCWAFNKFIDIPGELRVLAKECYQETDGEKTTQTEALADDWQKDPNLTKLEKQHKAILEVIGLKQFDPMAIPDGEKGTIKRICEADYTLLFDTESSFNTAWKGARHLFKMANHASFAKVGKQ